MEARWTLQESQISPDLLERELKVAPPVSRILSARGFDVPAARALLDADISGLVDPLELEGVREAAEVLKRAISRGYGMFIHGDYDVDGLTGAALLVRNLERLGARAVRAYVPDRFQEGYGLSMDGVEEARSSGARLLIAVDCGITAHEEIARAREWGMDVLVLDHHEYRGEVPEATAWADPKVSSYPHGELTGVGVAFKALDALYGLLDVDRKPLLWDLDLVALGTIADVAPLLGENRILVKYGLKVLNRTLKAGLKALIKEAELTGTLTSKEVAFGLAPRLNAAGRLTHAKHSLELLLTKNGDEARSLARVLCEENEERQEIERTILKEACDQVSELDLREHWGLVLAKEGWHEGVIGIVASMVVETYHRPAILLSVDGDRAKGSGRSIRGFDLYEALLRTRELFLSFGGHRLAAGMRMETDRIDELRKALNRIAHEVLSESDLTPEIRIDTKAELTEFKDAFFEDYERLAPFGAGNPAPVILIEDMEVVGDPKVMKDEHLKLTVRQGDEFMSAFAPRFGSMAEGLESGTTRLDLVFRLGKDAWSAREPYQLTAVDMRLREGG
jgi:single-stranded-DNA-specific exonuclease